MQGSVSEFDVEVGVGWVTDDRGGQWMFHCASIADGSRRIEVGQRVTFQIRPGGPGSWEAGLVSPIPF